MWLFLQAVNLGCENEVRLRQPIYRVRPGSDLDLAPPEQHVGMMSLFLCNLSNFIDKSQCGSEIGKLVATYEVVLVDNIPLRRLIELAMNFGEFFALERWNAAPAGNTGLVGELFGHEGGNPFECFATISRAMAIWASRARFAIGSILSSVVNCKTSVSPLLRTSNFASWKIENPKKYWTTGGAPVFATAAHEFNNPCLVLGDSPVLEKDHTTAKDANTAAEFSGPKAVHGCPFCDLGELKKSATPSHNLRTVCPHP